MRACFAIHWQVGPRICSLVMTDVAATPAPMSSARVTEIITTITTNYLPFNYSSIPIDGPAAAALLVGMLVALLVLQVLRAMWKWTCVRFCPCCGIMVDDERLLSAGVRLSDGDNKGRHARIRGQATRSRLAHPSRGSLRR